MVKTREATLKDVDQICSVLVDFYNMKDIAEAETAFLSEMEKEFHYIVATQNDKIIGLVTWVPHGLPKHGLLDLIQVKGKSEPVKIYTSFDEFSLKEIGRAHV